jgi:ribose-phosphate pyrophosphokinase
MIATAGSIVEAAQALKNAGAKDIYAAATHPVLSGPAVERIKNSVLKEVLVTNTIPLDDSKKINDRVRVLSVAPLLADAIKRIHSEESVSCLFD